jgi:hypothetical protein
VKAFEVFSNIKENNNTVKEAADIGLDLAVKSKDSLDKLLLLKKRHNNKSRINSRVDLNKVDL